MFHNILCVDEQGLTKLELSGMLKSLKINFINATCEEDAVNILNSGNQEINAIVWVLNTPDDESFESIRRIKNRENSKHIPIIIVSRFTDKKYIIRAIEAGAVEYIAKPYDEEAVFKKMCRILGIPNELAITNIDEDIVTFNFSEMFNREIKAASRGNHPLSLMLISVLPEDPSDDSVVERADDIVTLFNRVIKTKLRETDTIFHYGINNLIALLPFADVEGAKVVEKRVHDIFNTHTLLKRKNEGFKLVTASVTYPEDGKVRDKLLEKLEDNFNKRLGISNNVGINGQA